jgi:hypothetical protein
MSEVYTLLDNQSNACIRLTIRYCLQGLQADRIGQIWRMGDCDLYVVIWEPKHGRGGGHQLVMDRDNAERMSNRLAWERPDHVFRVEPAEAYAAAAVTERHNPPMSRGGNDRLRS